MLTCDLFPVANLLLL